MAEAKKFSASLLEDMGSSGNVVLDMATPIQFCVGNIICSILLGRTFDKGDPTFTLVKNTLDDHFRIIASAKILLVNSFPWLHRVPLFGHFGMDELKHHDEIVRGFITAEMERHIKGFNEDEEPSDFIEAYLKGRHGWSSIVSGAILLLHILYIS